MIFEWVAAGLIAAIGGLLDLVSTLLPGVSPASVGSTLGWLMGFNAVLPIAETLAVGSTVLAWRLFAGPITAVIGRINLFGIRFW